MDLFYQIFQKHADLNRVANDCINLNFMGITPTPSDLDHIALILVQAFERIEALENEIYKLKERE